MTDETRRYHNFAPFVRQIGERKAQTCAMAIFHHLRPSPIRVAAPITSELPTIRSEQSLNTAPLHASVPDWDSNNSGTNSP
jgi:hypothetical protein